MRLVLAVVVLAGCGRLGFGESRESDAAMNDSATVDASPLDEICGTDDADGDGVGDACDPSNAAPHHIVLFESFSDLPNWTITGAALWTVNSDGLHGMYTDTSASSFVSPVPFAPPFTITIRYTIEALDAGSSNFTISAVDAFDLVTEDSQKCGQASPTRNAIGHEMSGTTVDASSVQFDDSLMAGETYVTTFEHGLVNMKCTTAVPALGPGATVSVQHAPWRSSGLIGVRIRSIAATFHSLLVVALD